MNEEEIIIANARYVLRKYGVDASSYTVDIVDIGPDNVSLILREGHNIYFIAADDYLSDDEVYITLAEANGVRGLTPLKLLDAEQEGEYVTMFDHLMICKVYHSEDSSP